jgi:iron complex outermembrane receptor protein
VTNTEFGIKSDWSLLDRPVRTNLAIYQEKITNEQLQATVAGSNPVLTNVQNIGKAELKGFEFEFIFKATGNLELSGYISHVNPKYTQWDQYTGSPLYGTVDLTYRPFGYTSFNNAGLTVDYKLPLDSSVGTVKLRADASFHSRWKADNRQAGLVGLAAGVQGAIPTVQGFTMYERPGYGILNLRADWQHPFGTPIDLGMFVTNATDRAYFLGASALNGFVSAPVAPPRMFGVELSYKFGEGFKPK